ncbi:MAG: ATP-binding protein [Syntrophaceae bacterium]|nr:ATP-binding protein [Syntrophaceae bacterium]
MQRYINRYVTGELQQSLSQNPVTALIGPRQCGKSTLARHVLQNRKDALFLDLELPSDMRKLGDPELFLQEHADRLICIDEVQLKPDLFPLLRALIDKDRRPGRFLILGSASRDLVRQSGEASAGRIRYIELTPFTWTELAAGAAKAELDFKKHWWRGGFPPAFFAKNDAQSDVWRRDMIQDYLSRDIPSSGFTIPMPIMARFWKMLAHYHGGLLNASKFGQSMDISHNTVRKYIGILEQTFMVRTLQPLELNLKKRMVKSPKIYLRDSGILHTLLEIDNMTELYGHPAFGPSWEGWCIEQLICALPLWQPFFYRTSSGEEIDLVLLKGQKRLAFEIKASLTPHLSKGFADTIRVLKPERTWVVCPMTDPGYPIASGARVSGISECLKDLGALL